MPCVKCGIVFGDFEDDFPHLSVISHEDMVLVLCQNCWDSSSVNERIAYYRKLYEFWLERRITPHQTWNQLQEVVRRESSMSKHEYARTVLTWIHPRKPW